MKHKTGFSKHNNMETNCRCNGVLILLKLHEGNKIAKKQWHLQFSIKRCHFNVCCILMNNPAKIKGNVRSCMLSGNAFSQREWVAIILSFCGHISKHFFKQRDKTDVKRIDLLPELFVFVPLKKLKGFKIPHSDSSAVRITKI